MTECPQNILPILREKSSSCSQEDCRYHLPKDKKHQKCMFIAVEDSPKGKMYLKDVADCLGVSTPRAAQIERAALAKFQKHFVMLEDGLDLPEPKTDKLWVHSEWKHRRKLSEDDVFLIRYWLLPSGLFSQKEIAERFEVSQNTLSQIYRRAIWKNI